MNKLTAVFLDVLGRETRQESRAAAVAMESMKAEFSAKAGRLLSSGTIFCSDQGHKLQRDLLLLQKNIFSMTRAQQAAGAGAKLAALYIEAERLHRETQRQIHRPGKINIRKLHFFYHEEQTEALHILEDYIKAELYRILALEGGRAFLSRKQLQIFRHTLPDRIKYLKEEILPLTDSQKMKKKAVPHYWAAAYREERKAGPMGILPGFETVDPVKTDHRFLPGEHKELPYRRGVVLQGVGCLTNVTPGTIEQAQRKGALRTEVVPDQLAGYVDHLRNPDAVLGHLFSGSLYAIDAEQYFSAASYVTGSAALIRRKRLGQCLFCGKASGGSDFCEQCARRIRIV